MDLLYAPLAQLVEQLTLNQWALGSSPRWCTKKSLRSQDRGLFFGMHHGREQGGRPQAATNTTVRCWLARGISVAKNSALHCFLNAPADGAPSDKTCKRYTCGSFFALCAAERFAYGAPSPTGRAHAAPRCGLHSPRGDRSLKTVHCTVF